MSMASPQWKSYQAPVQDPAILAFQRSTNMSNFVPAAPSPASPAAAAVIQASSPTSLVAPPISPGAPPHHVNNSIRETGIIEKLLHSYGFIQCCDREARLFFHFSEYSGNLETITIGDPVEFQMSFDRRTGKPIAVSVVKLDQGIASCEILSEKRVTGTVCSEAKPTKAKLNGTTNTSTATATQDGLGRVSYEQSGEHFFLPYAQEDVESSTQLKSGDEVTFFVATDKRNGNVHARQIKLVKPVEPELFQGVICSMKDNYGFIERADKVKEIFFHFSEVQNLKNELALGDDVEFGIQTRNGKEVAVNIVRLPEGTVIFEDIAVERRRGRIMKTLKAPHGRRQSDPLAGRIVYETVKGPIEIPYGDKDQKGEYTLQQDDFVEFNIATDRRDKLQRATNITLVDETLKVNGEKRECGVIASLKDGFGFVRCADREARMFFHFSEMMEPETELKVQEEVEFTVIQDPTSPSRQIAIRIKYLPKGSVSFETVLPQKLNGNIEKEPSHKAQAKGREPDPGIIMYEVSGTKQTIPYSARAVQGSPPKYGDKIEFQICESRKNNTKTAVNVKLMTRSTTGKQYGFIATLKDSFGFIEMADHDKEVFFHFSACDRDASDLDIGDEVEFTLSRKTAKVSAENIKKVNRGTVAPEDVLPGFVDGRIIRCMRIINPDQDDYPGLVQVGTEDDTNPEVYPYGITSLADKKDFLQKGDIVKFQLAIVKSSGKKRATNLAAVRKYNRSKVDSIKDKFGFLTHEVEDGKKLFFHMTEVHDGVDLQPGDQVEFVIVQNQRNGKYSACSLRKITDTRRPERLFSRLKSTGDDSGPKVIVIRPPRGPNGSKGFTQERTPWAPPSL